MSQVPLQLSRAANGGFVLSAAGLDPNATYQLENSTTLATYPNSQRFTGADVMGGITIPRNGVQKYFRIRTVTQ